MNSIVDWFQGLTYLQIAFLAGGVSALWWIFAKRPQKYLAACLFFGAVMVGICAFPPEGDITLFRFLLLFAVFYAAYACWHNFANYEDIQVESIDNNIDLIDHERRLQVAQNNQREQREKTRHLWREINNRIKLDHIKLDSEVYSAETGQEVLGLDREEQRLRKSVLERSRQTGVPPDVINEVERERELGRVKTQQQYEEAAAVMAAGDILDTKDVQVIKKLTNDLAEEARKRQAVIDGNDAQGVKDILIAQHTANIEHIQRQINERQGRLVSSPNGKEARGHREGTFDFRGSEEPGDEGSQEQVSAPRRRGRPRKDSTQ